MNPAEILAVLTTANSNWPEELGITGFYARPITSEYEGGVFLKTQVEDNVVAIYKRFDTSDKPLYRVELHQIAHDSMDSEDEDERLLQYVIKDAADCTKENLYFQVFLIIASMNVGAFFTPQS